MSTNLQLPYNCGEEHLTLTNWSNLLPQ